MKFALLLTIAGCLVFSQTTDQKHTGQMSNGRVWREFTTSAKTGYVLAFFDAFHYDGLVGTAASPTSSIRPFRLTAGFNASDYIEKLDKLYGDAANVNVPLPFALQYCSVELAGKMTTQELENNLLDLRKLASTLAK
jgi:hypothetical protein